MDKGLTRMSYIFTNNISNISTTNITIIARNMEEIRTVARRMQAASQTTLLPIINAKLSQAYQK